MSYAQSLAIIENMNYARDRRSRGTEETTLELDDGTTIELPTKWEVCHACDGNGKHVATGVDCDGLTAEDFADDPDFAESYHAGAYDVTCETCHGRSTVRVVDVDALQPDIRALYEQRQKDEAEYRQMCDHERAYGC